MNLKTKELYYYITWACNLRCRHCYVGDNLVHNSHIDLSVILGNLQHYKQQGAWKVTFLGGEPTLHPHLKDILNETAAMGYERIILDTNGLARFPVAETLSKETLSRLAIRFSFEGASSKMHDIVRGPGTFRKSMLTLKKVLTHDVPVEVTLTLNSINYDQIPHMISFFTDRKVSEINFHFISQMGAASNNTELGMNAAQVLKAQTLLDQARSKSSIPIRFPKLIVKKEELIKEKMKGLKCRILDDEVILLFPEGFKRRCPLEITADLEHQLKTNLEAFESTGCPLSFRLFPDGLPENYVMTCISWKGH